MKIVDIRATTVTVPLEAPLRHANGAHWGRFVRTIVEVETDDGLVGLGEMGGGGESAEAAVRGLKPPTSSGTIRSQLEALRFKIGNPTARLYNNRTQLHAAIEFACLDLMGQQLGVPVHDLLGGKLRDAVPFASLPVLPLRRPGDRQGRGPHAGPARRARARAEGAARLRSPQAQGRRLPARLRAGVLPRAGRRVPRRTASATTRTPRCRVEEAHPVRATRSRTCNNDYLEDPTWGLNGHAPRREQVAHPARHEHRGGQLRAARRQRARPGRRRDPARHHLLGRDPAVRQGGRGLRDLPARRRRALLRRARHPARHDAAPRRRRCPTSPSPPTPTTTTSSTTSSSAARCPTWTARSPCPTGPGLGVELDREKLAEYAELYRELGGYPYDRDPGRPGWYPLVPNDRWADPEAGA